MTLALSLMSLMSPAGIGVEPFRTALRPGTGTPGGAVTEFRTEPEETTASRLRLVDRPSDMALATIENMLGEADEDGPRSRRALVLGSGAASIDQSMTVTRDSLTRPRPDNVNPALVPACVMNYASAQAAIRFGLHGPNATVTTGRVTGLTALGYTRRLLLRDRADSVICGTYEDLQDRRVAIADAAGITTPAAEGCCVFLAESVGRARSRGRTVLAEMLAVHTGVFAESQDAPAVLRDTVDHVLRQACVRETDIDLHVRGADDIAVADGVRTVRPADVFGDFFGAAAGFQLAAAVTEGDPDGLALVTSTDPDGHAGACLLRTAPTEEHQ